MSVLPNHCSGYQNLVSYTISYVKDGSPISSPNIIQLQDPTAAKSFQFYSMDPTDAGTYLITVNAEIPSEQIPSTGINWSTSSSFNLFVWNCNTNTLSIDTSMLSSLNIVYKIGDIPHLEILDDAKVTTPLLVTGCPSLEYYFENLNGSSIDASIFTFTPVTLEFKTETSDLTKNGIYELRLISNFQGYLNLATLNF